MILPVIQVIRSCVYQIENSPKIEYFEAKSTENTDFSWKCVFWRRFCPYCFVNEGDFPPDFEKRFRRHTPAPPAIMTEWNI